MFAEDPDAAKVAITANPARAHSDISRFMRIFLQPEHITLEEAIELCKTPRYIFKFKILQFYILPIFTFYIFITLIHYIESYLD